MRKRIRLVAGAVGGLALVGASAGMTYALGAASGVTSTTSDAVITTTASTNLSSSGGVQTTVESMKLPKGTWVLHADNSIVNFGPSDYSRCGIWSGASQVNTHASMVGDPSQSGAQGPAAFVATLSETGAVTLTAGTIVSVQCEHDTTNGATPYIDTGAVLWAHKGTSVVSLTTP